MERGAGAATEWRPPDVFEEYRIVRALGRGAMGHVYLAHDTLLDRPVAVKFIAAAEPDADTRERFFIEARAVARLQHPNVVAVYRVGEVRGRPYLISEYLRGESLDHLQKPLPWRRTLEIGIQLARGLAAAHRRGVLHRDLKPANAMLTEDGGTKLLDFGLAKLFEAKSQPAAIASVVHSVAPGGARATDGAVAPEPARATGERLQASSAQRATGAGADREDGLLRAFADSARAAEPGATVDLPEPAVPAEGAPRATKADVSGADFDSGPTRIRMPRPPPLDDEAPAATVDLPLADAAQGELNHGPTWVRTPSPPQPLAAAAPEPGATVDLPAAEPAAGASPRTAALSRLSPERAALTEAGAVLGSPLYMAPEAWRSDPATPQTDVYSFGALLYELCVGKAPWFGLSIPEIAAAALTRDVPSMRSAAPDVDPEFAAVIDRCLRRDPTERWESGEGLREALERLQHATPAAHLAPAENPYRGLMAFEAEHRSLFFGRGAEVRAILDRLRAEPWVAVAGDSGVGKSSICRAGVLPAVVDGALGGEPPRVITLVPGRRPLASFAAAIAPALGRDESDVAEQLRREPSEFARDLRRRVTRGGVFIFIDQLEELVTLADREEARLFSEALAPLVLPSSGVRLLTTARSDFLGRLAAAPGLGDGLSRALFLLKPLSADGVREAIVAPAAAAGFSFETTGMVDSLVESTARTDGSLPLLQFALAELWSARDAARRVISAEALRRLGGVEGALAKYADSVLEGFIGPMRGAARRILLKLVTAEGTRARRSEAELLAGDPHARPALEALVHGRLLIARDTEDGEGSYEVAHEALISGWGTLREWLTVNLETRAARHRLETAAQEWARLGRSPEGLWSARQLAESRAVDPEDVGPLEREFMARSRRELRRRRVVRAASAVGVVLGVAAVIGFAQLREARALEARLSALVGSAELAIAAAREQDQNAERARAEAFERFDGHQQQAAEDAWTLANAHAARRDQHFYDAEAALESARFLSPRDLDVVHRLAVLTRDRLLIAEREYRADKVAEMSDRLERFDPGGVLRAELETPAVVSIHTTPPGVQVSIEYAEPAGDSLRFGRPTPLGVTPLRDVQLRPGSAVIVLAAEGLATVRYPVLLERGERVELAPRMLGAAEVPAGFVFVPAGEYLSGSRDPDDLRRYFLFARPMQPRRTADFLISKYEVTYADWIAFLEALPPDERARRTPNATQARLYMSLQLKRDTAWSLAFSLPGARHEAHADAPLVYEGRQKNRAVDWLQMPVTAVSFADGEAFARWLDASGRVPRARMCTEDEWERAARGADGRSYPCGRALRTEDANFDATYGRVSTAFGPDAVGTYSECVSPVGLFETSGNVWELMRSSSKAEEVVFRGGCFYEPDVSAHLANANVADPHVRELRIGLRICADPPP